MSDDTTPERAKPFVIRMPTDLHAALKAKAVSEERSMAQAIRWAIWLYVTEDDH